MTIFGRKLKKYDGLFYENKFKCPYCEWNIKFTLLIFRSPARDDVIMPFWSERVIVLTKVEMCLEVRGGTVKRLKEREKRKTRSLPVYPRENTNKYYDPGTVKCVRLTLVDPRLTIIEIVVVKLSELSEKCAIVRLK